MKIIFISIVSVFFLISCWTDSEETKIETQKQILTKHLQEKVIEQKNKFEKGKTREKVEWFTWFLCTNDLLFNSWTKLEIEIKNCLEEKWEWSINFSMDWNIVYKNINWKDKTIILKLHKNDDKSITSMHFIRDKIIKNFSNNLERIYCSPIVNKYPTITIEDFYYYYNIWPFWFYKKEAVEQMEKKSDTIICEWYYNPDKWFIISDKKWEIIVEILKTDLLMNLNNIKIKVE